MKNKIYVEVNKGCVVSVYTEDFSVDELEFCVVDRDMRGECEESAFVNELFDALSESLVELYETSEVGIKQMIEPSDKERSECPEAIEAYVAELEAEAKENEEQIRNDMRETRILKAENAKLKAENAALKEAAKAVVDKRYDMGGAAEYNALAALVEDKQDG